MKLSNTTSKKSRSRLFAALLGLCSISAAHAQTFVTGNGVVGEYTTSGATINSSFLTTISDPGGIDVSGSDLFIANGAQNTIGEYTTSGTTVNASLISGSGLNDPVSIVVSGSDLFVTNWYAGTIGEYTTSGATVNSSLITGLNHPWGLAISGSNLFVTNTYSNTVGEYTTSGATVNTNLISGLSGPVGIAVWGSFLFVANAANGSLGNNTIGKYTTSGAPVNATFITSGWIQGIAISGNHLLVTNQLAGTIEEYDASTGAKINSSLISGLNGPYGIAVLEQTAAPISEENFNSTNYAIGSNLSGANPSVVGYTGSWVFDSSNPGIGSDGIGTGIVTSGPLSYPGTVSSGNTIVSSSGAFIDSRYLDTAGIFSSWADSNGNIGKPGTTLYMSFLMNVTSQPFALNESVWLTNGLFASNGSTTGVGGIYLGYSPLQNANDFSAYLTDTSNNPISGKIGDLGAIQQGATNFFVIKVQFGLNGTDTVSFYRNSTSESNPAFVVTTTGLDFNTLSLLRTGVGSGTLQVSDIRFGTTFFSVVVIPEETSLYFQNGTSLGMLSLNTSFLPNAWQGVGAMGSGWQERAIGDINGDGIPDIIFQNGNQIGAVIMNANGTPESWVGVGAMNSGWELRGVGEITGDGNLDLIFQNSTLLGYLEINSSGQPLSWKGIGGMGAGWQLRAVASLDGSGQPDLIFQNGTALGALKVNTSGVPTAWVGIGAMSSGWTLSDAVDVNGDGQPDLIFQNGTSLGALTVNTSLQPVAWYGIGAMGSGWTLPGDY